MTESPTDEARATANLFMHPPDLLQFEATEHQRFLMSLVSLPEELRALQHLHGLYAAAMKNQTTEEKNIIVIQLLTFTHYHFLFSTTCYMRCHMSEAYSSARAAIDAALIAAQIIHDRSAQAAYFDRTHPFDKLIRYFKNFIKDNKPLPSPLIPWLIAHHDACSQFASHADVQTFVHRLEFVTVATEQMMSFGYFQTPRDPAEMKYHFLGLLRIFTVILDIFANFIVDELKVLPSNWRDELHKLSEILEKHQQQLAGSISPVDPAAASGVSDEGAP